MKECKTIADRERELGPLCDELAREAVADVVADLDREREFTVRWQRSGGHIVEFTPEIEAALIESGSWCCSLAIEAFLRHARQYSSPYDVEPAQLARIRATYNYHAPFSVDMDWETAQVEQYFKDGYLRQCNGRSVRELIRVAMAFWNGYLRTRFKIVVGNKEHSEEQLIHANSSD